MAAGPEGPGVRLSRQRRSPGYCAGRPVLPPVARRRSSFGRLPIAGALRPGARGDRAHARVARDERREHRRGPARRAPGDLALLVVLRLVDRHRGGVRRASSSHRQGLRRSRSPSTRPKWAVEAGSGSAASARRRLRLFQFSRVDSAGAEVVTFDLRGKRSDFVSEEVDVPVPGLLAGPAARGGGYRHTPAPVRSATNF